MSKSLLFLPCCPHYSTELLEKWLSSGGGALQGSGSEHQMLSQRSLGSVPGIHAVAHNCNSGSNALF